MKLRDVFRRGHFATVKWLMALTMTSALVASAEATESVVLEIGLVPSLTARTLLTAFEPMRAYLEHHLKQPVRLSTAANFREFYGRTQKDEFDLLVTPAHFAWLAHREAGYTPLLTYTEQLSGLLIVGLDSPIRAIADLRGKRLGIADPLAIVTMRGLQVLREQGLRPEVDFSLQATAPHHAAAVAVAQGDLEAAIIGSGPYRIMAGETRARLRVLSELGSVPNAVYLAHKRIPPVRQRELQLLLQTFGVAADGKQFMAQYHYGGFKPVTAAELKSMEVYAEQAKRLLEANK